MDEPRRLSLTGHICAEFLHAGHRPVQPFEAEYPADDHAVAAHEHRPDALRGDRLRPRQDPAFVRHMGIAPDARRGLVLLHRGIRGVELLDRLGVRVLLDAGDEPL